jgi:hypothetical protein
MPKSSLLIAIALVAPLFAQTDLVLKNAFIDANKNRATMDITLEVDHVLKSPHTISSGGDDGDIHMSGRSSDIELPLVVEVMNARLPAASKAVADTHKADGGNTAAVSGAWRIWFEHPGGDQIQGDDVPVPQNTNPDHVFEIHPVTKFAGDSATESFVPIPGYTAYPAEKAFAVYENLEATISSTGTATTISATKTGYNYAEFVIQLAAAPTSSDDGGFLVLANVMKDSEETVVPDQRRMVFAPDTTPAKLIANCAAGATLHVLGIPRINLERVSFMTAQQPGQEFQAKLPYELIIVGVYPESVDACSVSASSESHAIGGNKNSSSRTGRKRSH